MEIVIVNSNKTREGEYIGRPSPLGNPYGWLSSHPEDLRVEDRDTAIKCYRSWLQSHLRTRTPRVLNELDRLAEIGLRDGRLVLRCWCAPLPCHGEVIKEVILEALKVNHETKENVA